MTTLAISNAQAVILEREAVSAYPRESCGLLIGYGDISTVVTGIIPSENRAEASDRFVIDPQLQIKWIRKLRGTDRRVIGPYHSHPNGMVEPSHLDKKMALESGQIWLIVPIQDGKARNFGAYKVTKEAGSFVPIPIVPS